MKIVQLRRHLIDLPVFIAKVKEARARQRPRLNHEKFFFDTKTSKARGNSQIKLLAAISKAFLWAENLRAELAPETGLLCSPS